MTARVEVTPRHGTLEWLVKSDGAKLFQVKGVVLEHYDHTDRTGLYFDSAEETITRFTNYAVETGSGFDVVAYSNLPEDLQARWIVLYVARNKSMMAAYRLI